MHRLVKTRSCRELPGRRALEEATLPIVIQSWLSNSGKYDNYEGKLGER